MRRVMVIVLAAVLLATGAWTDGCEDPGGARPRPAPTPGTGVHRAPAHPTPNPRNGDPIYTPSYGDNVQIALSSITADEVMVMELNVTGELFGGPIRYSSRPVRGIFLRTVRYDRHSTLVVDLRATMTRVNSLRNPVMRCSILDIKSQQQSVDSSIVGEDAPPEGSRWRVFCRLVIPARP